MKNLKKSAGFTLVELIVVIAILGILAGVGTVAYTGYVDKAKEAADQQLLSAVNLAFASACIDSGTDINNVESASTTGGKKVTGITATDKNGVVISSDSFMAYFAGNEESEFQTGTPDFVPATHLFTLKPNQEERTLTFTLSNGGKLKFSSTDVENVKKSTFYTASGLGVSGLLSKVNDVSKFTAAIGTGSNFMKGIYESDAFIAYAAKAMGMAEGTTYQQLQGKLATLSSESGANAQDIVANATVVFAAHTAADMNSDDIMAMLKGGDGDNSVYNSIIGNLSTDPSKAMANAALAYGMYTAYANSEYGSEDAKTNADNPANVILELDNDSGFKNYLNSAQAQTDLAGYLAALKMIDDSADDTSTVSHAITKGFNDSELVDAFGQAVGQN